MTERHPVVAALDFDGFLAVVAERTGLAVDGEGRDGHITLDSFAALELLVLCEELAGVVPGDAPLPVVASLRDAHRYFTGLVGTEAP